MVEAASHLDSEVALEHVQRCWVLLAEDNNLLDRLSLCGYDLL